MHDQVLFTADLKSFSSYGLPSPSPSVDLADASSSHKKTMVVPPTPSLTPSPSPAKRQRERKVRTEVVAAKLAVRQENAHYLDETSDGATSLVDRVKKRRRVTVAVTGKS